MVRATSSSSLMSGPSSSLAAEILQNAEYQQQDKSRDPQCQIHMLEEMLKLLYSAS